MTVSTIDPTALAFGLILFSAMLHAVYNAFLKAAGDKLIARMLMALASTVYLAPLVFFIPLPTPALFALLGFTAFVHFAYQMSQIASLHHGDYTLAYPVARGSAPLVTAMAAPLVLGDVVNGWQMAGIAVVSIAILSMALSGRGGNARGLFFAVLTGLFIAAYTLIDAKGVRMAANPATFIIWFFIFDSFVISTYTVIFHRHRLVNGFAREIGRAALNGVLGIGTFGAALLAFRFGSAPVMAALRETSVLFAALIGFAFLGERLPALRMLAIAGILAGVVIIRLAP